MAKRKKRKPKPQAVQKQQPVKKKATPWEFFFGCSMACTAIPLIMLVSGNTSLLAIVLASLPVLIFLVVAEVLYLRARSKFQVKKGKSITKILNEMLHKTK